MIKLFKSYDIDSRAKRGGTVCKVNTYSGKLPNTKSMLIRGQHKQGYGKGYRFKYLDESAVVRDLMPKVILRKSSSNL